jgi:DNA-binding FrmR family transcriptional regulator
MRPGYIESKEALQKRLRRVEGQVRGLQRMVDEDRYCIEILEQVSAATKALQAVALELLDDHLAHCETRRAASDGQRGAGACESREIAQVGQMSDQQAMDPGFGQTAAQKANAAEVVHTVSLSGGVEHE